MNNETVMDLLKGYEARLKVILERYTHTSNSLSMHRNDHSSYRQLAQELIDLLNDCLGDNTYSKQIVGEFVDGHHTYTGSPSFRSVENILAIVRAAITRLSRNPDLLGRKKAGERLAKKENIFIIHGRDEAKWRELKDIIQNQFRLNPIVLAEQPDAGCKTVIEKFEHYAELCAYAIAVFTPDDEVNTDSAIYLQARPNVIYELGWFCGRLTRSGAMLLLKEGTSLFSDFGGIVQKRFVNNISEKTTEIKRDLVAAGILADI